MVSRSGVERFGLSPLIRTTLLSLYVALVLPLPLLAPQELRWWMAAGLFFGLILVLGLLSEQAVSYTHLTLPTRS